MLILLSLMVKIYLNFSPIKPLPLPHHPLPHLHPIPLLLHHPAHTRALDSHAVSARAFVDVEVERCFGHLFQLITPPPQPAVHFSYQVSLEHYRLYTQIDHRCFLLQKQDARTSSYFPNASQLRTQPRIYRRQKPSG